MKTIIRSVLANKRGSSAAEFAMVLPLLLIFIFGLIDAGRFMFACNSAEKATQMGVRYAVATDIVPVGLANSFVGTGGLGQGDSIPQSSFGGASCVSADSGGQAASVTCSCTGTCPSLGTASVTAFNNILTRMQAFFPQLKANQFQVEYAYSGLGYAGDPNGIDVAPIVRVGLRQEAQNRPSFEPITLLVFGASIPLPSFSATLTMEDGQGTVSN